MSPRPTLRELTDALPEPHPDRPTADLSSDELAPNYDRQWRLTLFVNWLLVVLLACTTALLFVHATKDQRVVINGCFAGSNAVGDSVVVTWGDGPICEGEK